MNVAASRNERWRGRRILLATSELAHPLAQGGIQASAHDLLIGLGQIHGADARLLTAGLPGHFDRYAQRLRALGIDCSVCAEGIDYRPGAYRATLTASSSFVSHLDAVVRDWRPDLIVAQAAGWREVVGVARAARRPVVHWLHGWLGLLGEGPRPAADLLLANSEYTAAQVSARFGLGSTVFHPPVEPERVRAPRTAGAGGAITMINPHPSKGFDIFLSLARRHREQRFVAVDCWGTAPYIALAISRESNIDHLPVQDTMRTVFAQSALLVVPTTSDETFGRVVVEAQLNGIPVLASDRGALPDVVGAGGLVVASGAPLAEWDNAMQNLIGVANYPGFSRAARENAERFDFPTAIQQFAHLVDSLRSH